VGRSRKKWGGKATPTTCLWIQKSSNSKVSSEKGLTGERGKPSKSNYVGVKSLGAVFTLLVVAGFCVYAKHGRLYVDPIFY
jgi:hypothetical protein